MVNWLDTAKKVLANSGHPDSYDKKPKNPYPYYTATDKIKNALFGKSNFDRSHERDYSDREDGRIAQGKIRDEERAAKVERKGKVSAYADVTPNIDSPEKNDLVKAAKTLLSYPGFHEGGKDQYLHDPAGQYDPVSRHDLAHMFKTVLHHAGVLAYSGNEEHGGSYLSGLDVDDDNDLVAHYTPDSHGPGQFADGPVQHKTVKVKSNDYI